MNADLTYSKESYLPKRFYNHLKLGLWSGIHTYPPSFIEKVGNVGLWPIENVPSFFVNQMQNPKVLTIAFTALAMLTDSYLFYSAQTISKLRKVWSIITQIPFWAIKFAAYLSTCEIILSGGLRAYGRFSNSKLMNDFYADKQSDVASER
jgi:hypothetical protein